ncbi:MAG: hypothetical protein ACI4KR_09510 [Ruminiclostridium sp.]
MEIKNLQASSINAYRKLTRTTSVKKNTAAAKEAVNTDKVEFDFGRYLDAAKANAASGADSAASADRLAALAEKYAGDNCPVSAEDTADAMFF